MKIERLKYDLTVCKVQTENDIDMSMEFYTIGKTDEDVSAAGSGREGLL